MGDRAAYNICLKGGSGEIEEKKSRFIATVRPIHSEEEAASMIAELKKKYWDATHNCSAYITGDGGSLQRCSDDGEPSQTAGRPMLDVLLGRNIRDICVVVTRYFGGTLLGTGGLVRAYQAATIAGLKESLIAEKKRGVLLSYSLDYDLYGKLEYLVNTNSYNAIDSQFTDKVLYTILVPAECEEEFIKKSTEASTGRAILKERRELSYVEVEGKVEILE